MAQELTTEETSDGIPIVVGQAMSQDEGTVACSVDCSAENAGGSGLRQSVAIKIPFSVYTATNGYDWSNIPENSERDGLDYYYQKAVERKPDFMSAGDVVKGVFARDGNIAAFRIQVVKHWDSFGRNADYCAFAFLTYEEACRVDFDALLTMPEFTDPRHDPPTNISYSGEASKDINSEDSVAAIKKLHNGESLQSFDFAKIGALLSAHGSKSDDWLFCKVECAIEKSMTVSTGAWNTDPYPRPPPPPPPPPPLRPQPEATSGVPFSAAQPIAPVVLPEATPAPQPSPESISSDSQEARRTVVRDTRPRTQIPVAFTQNAYRAPVTGNIRNVRGCTCKMIPLTPQEQSCAVAQKSNGLLGLSTLELVLMGVCAVLVVVLLVATSYFFMLRNEYEFSRGDATGNVGVTKEIDSTQNKSIEKDNSKPGPEKGGK